MKNDLAPACDFQISLKISCESTWPGLNKLQEKYMQALPSSRYPNHINCNILHLCMRAGGVILPTCLRVPSKKAAIKIDIMGFTEEEGYHFIEQSLKRQPQSMEKLNHCLQDHFTISNL